MRACGKTDVGLRRHENQDTFAVEQGKKLLIAVVSVSYTHLTLPTT